MTGVQTCALPILPGIAGFILTIGMGVDSNVLVFERIRDTAMQFPAPPPQQARVCCLLQQGVAGLARLLRCRRARPGAELVVTVAPDVRIIGRLVAPPGHPMPRIVHYMAYKGSGGGGSVETVDESGVARVERLQVLRELLEAVLPVGGLAHLEAHAGQHERVRPQVRKPCPAEDDAARDVNEIRGGYKVADGVQDGRYSFPRENVAGEKNARQDGEKGELHGFGLGVGLAGDQDAERERNEKIGQRKNGEDDDVAAEERREDVARAGGRLLRSSSLGSGPPATTRECQ